MRRNGNGLSIKRTCLVWCKADGIGDGDGSQGLILEMDETYRKVVMMDGRRGYWFDGDSFWEIWIEAGNDRRGAEEEARLKVRSATRSVRSVT